MTTGRNLHIDRLRGVAIAVVVLLHYRMYAGPNMWPLLSDQPILFYLIRNGFYGVTMFFVVSGFLITSMSLRRWGSLDLIKFDEFYTMRAGRILPSLILLLIVLCGLSALGFKYFEVPDHLSMTEAVWYAITFRYHWILGPYNVDHMQSWTILWSLSVEELFYIIFPMAAVVFRSRRALIIALVVAIISGPSSRAQWSLYTLPGSIDALSMGCLTAIIMQKLTIQADTSKLLRWVGISVGLIAYLVAPFNEAVQYGPSFIALGAALFLAGSSDGGNRPAIFWLPDDLLRFFGRNSYELYLFHMVVIVLFAHYPLHNFNISPPAAFFIINATIWAVAWAIAKFYSELSNKWIRKNVPVIAAWIGKRLERLSADPPAAVDIVKVDGLTISERFTNSDISSRRQGKRAIGKKPDASIQPTSVDG